MGLFKDLIKDVTREAKSALTSEIRSEVRQETRNAVRGTISGAKQKIGEATQKAKENAAKKEQIPESSAISQANAAEVTDGMANAADTMQPLAQMMNDMKNDTESVQGKFMNAMINSKMTEAQKAEMKEGLEALSDPTKVTEAKQAMNDNSAEVVAKLKEAGIDPEALKAFLNQGTEAAKQIDPSDLPKEQL